MAVSHGSLPFQEQIDFFRGKTNLPTRAWADVYKEEHDWAFVVAGASKRDLLIDLRGSVEKAIANGGTLEQFRKDFDQVVGKHGWQYNGGRGWRTRVIYETNLRQSYNAGREAQMVDPELRKARPYGLYRHGDSAHPRPMHLSWNGTVLPLDDPWWSTHSPQNGWGCKCKKFMVSERDVERQGLKVGPAPAIEYEEKVVGMNSPLGPRSVRVPVGIDPGFDYAPGQSRLSGAVPQIREPGQKIEPTPGVPSRTPARPLPEARPVTEVQRMPKGLTPAAQVDRFLKTFGAKTDAPAVFRDLAGDPLVIGRGMFEGADGQLRLPPGDLLLLAQAIREPDEIWARLDWLEDQKRAFLRKRYVSRFTVAGQAEPEAVVVEMGSDGWTSTVEDGSGADDLLASLRVGVRLYRRYK
ncbi:hypothetical protein DBR45_06485 [Pseudomonas sp. HMWF031]|nr:hypothetical protein DBR45_06485 [Pseudomonas sp. HMWF031]